MPIFVGTKSRSWSSKFITYFTALCDCREFAFIAVSQRLAEWFQRRILQPEVTAHCIAQEYFLRPKELNVKIELKIYVYFMTSHSLQVMNALCEFYIVYANIPSSIDCFSYFVEQFLTVGSYSCCSMNSCATIGCVIQLSTIGPCDMRWRWVKRIPSAFLAQYYPRLLLGLHTPRRTPRQVQLIPCAADARYSWYQVQLMPDAADARFSWCQVQLMPGTADARCSWYRVQLMSSAADVRCSWCQVLLQWRLCRL